MIKEKYQPRTLSENVGNSKSIFKRKLIKYKIS